MARHAERSTRQQARQAACQRVSGQGREHIRSQFDISSTELKEGQTKVLEGLQDQLVDRSLPMSGACDHSPSGYPCPVRMTAARPVAVR
jgi:hypothetical protein